ncbi:hypothetical protein J4764_26775 [Burkholderia pseudomallei]|nr:hypothetical protein BHT10_21285 [Burkholderia pseudomallei]MBF3410136.1 hypothetical protein [Burkholderia pseudomallei]MBF3444665.1 hypothetical protein [Burkholderia pseudomallei]MBF3450489.1 hypothetical protein [Burkholderia pseudomallei]MBF3468720.1 hypothetical protein [Burkholderia pseudomallei]
MRPPGSTSLRPDRRLASAVGHCERHRGFSQRAERAARRRAWPAARARTGAAVCVTPHDARHWRAAAKPDELHEPAAPDWRAVYGREL